MDSSSDAEIAAKTIAWGNSSDAIVAVAVTGPARRREGPDSMRMIGCRWLRTGYRRL